MNNCDHFDKDHHPVMWNEFNKVVQCLKCGEQFVPPPPPNADGKILPSMRAYRELAIRLINKHEKLCFLDSEGEADKRAAEMQSQLETSAAWSWLDREFGRAPQEEKR